MKAQN